MPDVRPPRRARIYKRGPRLYLHTVSLTPQGAWVMATPAAALTPDASETFIGEALVDALSASRTGARDATDTVKKVFLEKARVKTWAVFMRGTFVCDVERDDGAVRFFPFRTGARRPYVPACEPRLVLKGRVIPIELGGALLAALRAIEIRRGTGPKGAAAAA
jgi:hypothetical protein